MTSRHDTSQTPNYTPAPSALLCCGESNFNSGFATSALFSSNTTPRSCNHVVICFSLASNTRFCHRSVCSRALRYCEGTCVAYDGSTTSSLTTSWRSGLMVGNTNVCSNSVPWQTHPHWITRGHRGWARKQTWTREDSCMMRRGSTRRACSTNVPSAFTAELSFFTIQSPERSAQQ